MRPEEICSRYNNSIIVRRWAATWLDFLLFLGVIIALVSVAGEKHSGIAVLVWIVLTTLYYPLLEGLTGKTFGKWICRLTIVDEYGNRPGMIKALVRTLFRLLEVNPLVLGGLPAGIAVISSKKRQRLGDMVANTYVLQTEDLHYLTMPSIPPAMIPSYGPPASIPSPSTPGAYPPPYPAYMAPQVPNGPDYDIIAPMPATGTPLSQPPYSNTNYPNYQSAPTPYFHPATPPNLHSATPSKFRKWAGPLAGILTLTGLGLIFGSIFENERENSHHSPITQRCSDFLKSPADHGWYHLTHCNIDLTGALIYTERAESGIQASLNPKGTLTDVYLPVFGSADAEDSKTTILLHTKDPHAIHLVDTLRKMDGKGDAVINNWVKDHLNELEIQRDITGTLEVETGQTNASHEDLLKLDTVHLDPKFVILEEGGTPLSDKLAGVILLGVLCLFPGLILGISVIATHPSRKKDG